MRGPCRRGHLSRAAPALLGVILVLPLATAAEVGPLQVFASLQSTNGGAYNPAAPRDGVLTFGVLLDSDGDGAHDTRLSESTMNLSRVEPGARPSFLMTVRCFRAGGAPMTPCPDTASLATLRRVDVTVFLDTDENSANGWDQTAYLSTPVVPG